VTAILTPREALTLRIDTMNKIRCGALTPFFITTYQLVNCNRLTH